MAYVPFAEAKKFPSLLKFTHKIYKVELYNLQIYSFESVLIIIISPFSYPAANKFDLELKAMRVTSSLIPYPYKLNSSFPSSTDQIFVYPFQPTEANSFPS